MPRFIRFKLAGCTVLEIDISTIQVIEIFACEDESYSLTAYSDAHKYELLNGTFDECHYMLNQLHDLLDVEVIDLK